MTVRVASSDQSQSLSRSLSGSQGGPRKDRGESSFDGLLSNLAGEHAANAQTPGANPSKDAAAAKTPPDAIPSSLSGNVIVAEPDPLVAKDDFSLVNSHGDTVASWKGTKSKTSRTDGSEADADETPIPRADSNAAQPGAVQQASLLALVQSAAAIPSLAFAAAPARDFAPPLPTSTAPFASAAAQSRSGDLVGLPPPSMVTDVSFQNYLAPVTSLAGRPTADDGKGIATKPDVAASNVIDNKANVFKANVFGDVALVRDPSASAVSLSIPTTAASASEPVAIESAFPSAFAAGSLSTKGDSSATADRKPLSIQEDLLAPADRQHFSIKQDLSASTDRERLSIQKDGSAPSGREYLSTKQDLSASPDKPQPSIKPGIAPYPIANETVARSVPVVALDASAENPLASVVLPLTLSIADRKIGSVGSIVSSPQKNGVSNVDVGLSRSGPRSPDRIVAVGPVGNTSASGQDQAATPASAPTDAAIDSGLGASRDSAPAVIASGSDGPVSSVASITAAASQPASAPVNVSATTSVTALPAPLQSVADAVVSLAAQPATSAQVSSDTPARVSPARTMLLQLNPGELGMVSVRLHLTGRTLDVSLTASKDQTAALLDRGRDTLTRAIGDQDYQLNSLVIERGGGQRGETPSPSGNSNGAMSDNARQQSASSGGGNAAGGSSRQGGDGPQTRQDRSDRQPAPKPDPAARGTGLFF